MQGMGVSRHTRVHACALVVLAYLKAYLDFARPPFYQGQLFVDPHAKAPCGKREETLLFPPAPITDVGVKEEKRWPCVPACQHQGTHKCSSAICKLCVCMVYSRARANT